MLRQIKTYASHSSGLHAVSYVAVLLVGLAIGNAHKTADAINGTQAYFVHRYCPQVAAKAAAGAARKQRERDASASPWWTPF